MDVLLVSSVGKGEVVAFHHVASPAEHEEFMDVGVQHGCSKQVAFSDEVVIAKFDDMWGGSHCLRTMVAHIDTK